LCRRFAGVTAGPAGIKIGGGTSSIGSPTTALIVIDGVPDGNINSVVIDDIEEISVLKDASIYGVRGANGAILIKTRR
jgi:TonB-dependent SusC/RagA subfamily outer membrane receptor